MKSCSFFKPSKLVGAIACFRQLLILSRYVLHQSISLCLEMVKALCRMKPSHPNLSRSPKKLPVSPSSTTKQFWEFRTVAHINLFEDRFHYERPTGKSHTQNPVIQSSPSLVAKSLLPLHSCCAKNDPPRPALLSLATIKLTTLSQRGTTTVHNTSLVSDKT